MGLFGRKSGWVRGTATVVATNVQKPEPYAQSLLLRAVIEGPGIVAFDDQRRFMIKSYRWPSTGQVLPVRINPKNPTKWEVLWDEADSGVSRADAVAANLLAQANGGSAERSSAAADGPLGGGIADQLQQMFPGASISVSGQQPVDLGLVAEAVSNTPGTSHNVAAHQHDADPVERLEKLAKLRDAGVIGESEFETLKAQIIGQAGTN